jgi:hypothetical protein
MFDSFASCPFAIAMLFLDLLGATAHPEPVFQLMQFLNKLAHVRA